MIRKQKSYIAIQPRVYNEVEKLLQDYKIDVQFYKSQERILKSKYPPPTIKLELILKKLKSYKDHFTFTDFVIIPRQKAIYDMYHLALKEIPDIIDRNKKLQREFKQNSILAQEGVSVNSSTESFILAVENYLDEWETEEYVNYIFEAEGANPSGIRKALNKLTSAFKKKDKKGVERAHEDLKDELDDYQKEIENADTPEKKKKLSKKTKIIIGAVIVAAAAAAAVGIKKGVFTDLINKLKKADKSSKTKKSNKDDDEQFIDESIKHAEDALKTAEDVGKKMDEAIQSMEDSVNDLASVIATGKKEIDSDIISMIDNYIKKFDQYFEEFEALRSKHDFDSALSKLKELDKLVKERGDEIAAPLIKAKLWYDINELKSGDRAKLQGMKERYLKWGARSNQLKQDIAYDKLQSHKKNVATEIRDRHREAGKIIGKSLDNITKSHRNMDDNDKEFAQNSKDLDDLLKDL